MTGGEEEEWYVKESHSGKGNTFDTAARFDFSTNHKYHIMDANGCGTNAHDQI